MRIDGSSVPRIPSGYDSLRPARSNAFRRCRVVQSEQRGRRAGCTFGKSGPLRRSAAWCRPGRTRRIACETVDDISASDEPLTVEWRKVRDANGSGGPNEDTARTKRR
jgi:hypothetical protein